jgi:hypothetical protein
VNISYFINNQEIHMGDPPVPDETGASGTQIAGSQDSLSLDATPPTSGLPITHVLDGLAATRARSLGGEVAANLIAGSFNQLAHDLEVTRADLRTRDEQLRNAQQDLGNANVTIATLRERVGAISRLQNLKQLGIFVGTALMSVAIELYKSNLEKISYILAALGFVLFLAGWITKRIGGDE